MAQRKISFLTPAILTLALLLFVSCAQSAGPQGGHQGGPHGNFLVMKPQNRPFLITGKLPHLTLYLMRQWDDPQLALTPEQKEKLLIIRHKTMGEVKELAKQILNLENQVVQGVNAGKSPAELAPLVRKIAELKTRATMVQLQCIQETKKILTPEQMSLLLKNAQH